MPVIPFPKEQGGEVLYTPLRAADSPFWNPMKEFPYRLESSEL